MLMQTYFVVRHRRHRHVPNQKKMTYFFLEMVRNNVAAINLCHDDKDNSLEIEA